MIIVVLFSTVESLCFNQGVDLSFQPFLINN
jgi:hypothetical protein